MIYVLKKLIGALGGPLLLAILLGAAAAAARARGRRRIAFSFMVSAVVVGYLGSIERVGDALLDPLEHGYPSLSEDNPPPAVGYVVVLGSGYMPRSGLPVTAALDREGLVRIVEGVRLIRRLGVARLVVSGGAPSGHTPPAFGYAQLARELGVESSSIVLLSRALDTGSEAHDVVALLGSAPFILVTSASHMPRAIRLMKLAGAHPIPAPTGQQAGTAGGGAFDGWIPTSIGLRKSEQALHEYLGLAAMAAGVE